MKVKTNLIIDIAIFIALLIALEPALTGIPIHEWFSVAFAVTIIVHLLLHWDWIAKVLARFFRSLLKVSRLQLVLDVLLFLAFNTVMLSGFLLSRDVLPFFGLRPMESPVMRVLHSWSANATLVMVGVHFAFNWNWVVSAIGRYIVVPIAGLFKRKPAAAPVTAPASQD